MKEHGLVSNFQDYLDLPLAVIEDWRMMAEGIASEQEQRARASRRAGR